MKKLLIPIIFLFFTVGCTPSEESRQEKINKINKIDATMSQFLEANDLDENKANCKQRMNWKECFIIYKNNIGEFKKISITCWADGECRTL